MFLSKLVNVITTLEKPAYKRLHDFLISPYFRIPTASIDLFEYLDSIYPNFTERKLQPEAIGKASSNLNTRAKAARAGTDLLTSIEHFLAMEDWQKDDLRVNWHLFTSLQKLQLLNQYEVEYKQIFKRIEGNSEQDIETFFYRHIYTELSNTGIDLQLNRTIRNDLSPAVTTLDEFYSLKLLRYMCEAVSRKQVLGVNYNDVQMQHVLDVLAPFTNSQFPYPYLFVNVYKLLKEESYEVGERYYVAIKKFIGSQSDLVLPPSSIEAMGYAINWCLLWVGRGYEEVGKEYLWWTELKMKYGLLVENGILMPITFRNIILAALFNAEKPEWVVQFIKKYGPFLPAAYQETYVAFAYGLYFYRTKEYTKALQSFLTAQAKEDIIFNAIIRRWQYMATYDQNPTDIDFLLTQLDTFERYVVRNKEALHQVKGLFQMFINYSRRILDISNPKKRSSVKEDLNKEIFFPGKPWLVDKL